MEIEQNVWGFTPEGEAVIIYKIINASGAYVELINFGAAVRSIVVPDRNGTMADVALGYRDMQGYMQDTAAMCKTVGRYANRIADGRFTLDGTEYTLARNAGKNHLHGGANGFQSRLWESRVEGNQVVFSLVSPDGDQSYPATLGVEAAFYWSDDNRLEITYYAESDAATIVNLTSHLYFNLGGESSGSVLNHVLQLDADAFLPTDASQIPTGELRSVDGTPMDFRNPKALGRDIESDYNFMREVGGYDHCWAVRGWRRNILGRVGSLCDTKSGRRVEFLSSQPGVQIYTGNFLGGTPVSASGNRYADHDGVAVECQSYPDSPNKPEFPSVVLRAGERYVAKTVYAFSAE